MSRRDLVAALVGALVLRIVQQLAILAALDREMDRLRAQAEFIRQEAELRRMPTWVEQQARRERANDGRPVPGSRADQFGHLLADRIIRNGSALSICTCGRSFAARNREEADRLWDGHRPAPAIEVTTR